MLIGTIFTEQFDLYDAKAVAKTYEIEMFAQNALLKNQFTIFHNCFSDSRFFQ